MIFSLCGLTGELPTALGDLPLTNMNVSNNRLQGGIKLVWPQLQTGSVTPATFFIEGNPWTGEDKVFADAAGAATSIGVDQLQGKLDDAFLERVEKNSKRKRSRNSAPAQPVNNQPDALTYRCGECRRETRVRTVRTPITIFGVDIERRPTLKACPACELGVPALASPRGHEQKGGRNNGGGSGPGNTRGAGASAPAAQRG